MGLSRASVARVQAKVVGQPGRNMLNMFGSPGKTVGKPGRTAVKGGSKTGYAASGKDSSMPKISKAPKRMSQSSMTSTGGKRKNQGGNTGPSLPANKPQSKSARKGID